MKQTYELPPNLKLSKKEEQEVYDFFNGYPRSFLHGLLFVVTVPIKIYKLIHKWREKTLHNHLKCK